VQAVRGSRGPPFGVFHTRAGHGTRAAGLAPFLLAGVLVARQSPARRLPELTHSAFRPTAAGETRDKADGLLRPGQHRR